MYVFATLDHGSLRDARIRTNLTTAAIFAGMITILYLCAGLVIGNDAVLTASAVALFLVTISTNPPVGLVMRFARAVPIPRREATDLYADLAELSRRAGLTKTPSLWWIGSPGISAFATGRHSDSGIAVSDGALRMLSRRELVSVLAHEIAHLAAGDTRLLSVGAVLTKVTHWFAMLGMLASMVLLFLTGDPDEAPVWQSFALCLAAPAVALLYLGLSRNREFAADLMAAQLTGDAVGLARALERLERLNREGGARHALLRTHPPTAERVNRLLGSVRLVSSRPALIDW